jgi:hypothetical protein
VHRKGWAGLQTAEAATSEGAPSFAYFAKGGYNDGMHSGWCRTDKSCPGSIAAHPYKNARMGHPPWEWCNAKIGHRPLYIVRGEIFDPFCVPFTSLNSNS